jgi:hypothetical protein
MGGQTLAATEKFGNILLETEGPLPYLPDPATDPCLDSDGSTLYHPILFCKIHFDNISHLHTDLMPCPSHCPWFDHSNYNRQRVQATKAPHYAVSPTSCHFILVHILLSTCFLTSLACVLSLMAETKFNTHTNHSQNFSSVHPNVYVFRQQVRR